MGQNQKDAVVVEDGVKECVSQKPSTLQAEMKESSLPNLSPGEGSEAGVSLRRLCAITGNWKFSDTFKKRKKKPMKETCLCLFSLVPRVSADLT